MQQRDLDPHGKHDEERARAAREATHGRDMRPEQREVGSGAHGGAAKGSARVLRAGLSYHLVRGSKQGTLSTFLWSRFGKEYDLILEIIPPADQV